VPKRKNKNNHTEKGAMPIAISAPEKRWPFLLAVAILLVLAAFLRCYRLGHQEVWMDEAFSALVVQLDGRQLLAAFMLESNPPLYFLLLKVFGSLFGYSPVSIRALSVILSVCTVAVVLLYGSWVVSRRFAFGAAVFLTVSPYSLYYAQEARGYSLLLLLLVTALLACYDAVKNRSMPAVWVFAVTILAAGYTHYFAALTIAPLAIWLLFTYVRQPETRGTLRWLFIALIVDTIACAAWMLPSLAGRDVNPQLWIAEQWAHLDKVWLVPTSLQVLVLGSVKGATPLFLKQMTLLAQPKALSIIALSSLGGMLVWALSARLKTAHGSDLRRIGWLLLGAVLLPLLILFAVSFVKPLYVVGRYDIVAFPLVILLMGWLGVVVAQSTGVSRFGLGAAAVLFVGSLIWKDAMLLNSGRVYHDYDAARSAELLDMEVANGDLVVFTGMRGTSIIYYLSMRGYEWDGTYCRKADRQLVVRCRLLPYTDSGVPFVMGLPITTPVTVEAAMADIRPVLTDTARANKRIVIAIARDRAPVNRMIDQRLQRLLFEFGYRPDSQNRELRAYQIHPFALRVPRAR
jgi:mannosyltransferase